MMEYYDTINTVALGILIVSMISGGGVLFTIFSDDRTHRPFLIVFAMSGIIGIALSSVAWVLDIQKHEYMKTFDAYIYDEPGEEAYIILEDKDGDQYILENYNIRKLEEM